MKSRKSRYGADYYYNGLIKNFTVINPGSVCRGHGVHRIVKLSVELCRVQITLSSLSWIGTVLVALSATIA